MAELIDLWKGKSQNDVWKTLHKMGFSKKHTTQWYTTRYNSKEYQDKEGELVKLSNIIVVHGDGTDLIEIQDDLTERNVVCQTPAAHDNLFYNYLIIGLSEEKQDPDVSQDAASDETSTLNSNEPPQS
jgi:hypothetical protein